MRPTLLALTLAAPALGLALGLGCVDEPGDDGDADADGAVGAVDVDAPLLPDTPRASGDPAACDPGRHALHRLNRTEYDRTVKDLLGVASTPVAGFPADDVAAGFDNNADVLSTSPLLVEKLDAAAQEIALALFPDVTGAAEIQTLQAEDVGGAVGVATGEFWNLFAAGDVTASVTTTVAGRYAVRVRADQQAAGPDAARMTIRVDDVDLVTVDVDGLDTYAVETELSAGEHRVTARFDNDFYNPDAGEDRNLLVDFVEVEGPLGVVGSSAGHDRFVFCAPADQVPGGDVDGCARATLQPILARAFRRPVDDAEVTPYVGLVSLAVTHGDAFDAGLRLATEALLLSPAFYFRAEFDVDGSGAAIDGAHRVSTYELAARLSYFLWATLPDEALFARAADGSLANKSVLKLEVERMLRDPRAQGGVVDALAGQWLNTRGLDNVSPDPERYPLPDDIKSALKRETLLVVQELLKSDRSAKDLLDVDFTFVNAPLAAFYGLPFDPVLAADGDDDDDGFIRVSLAGTNRAGVLTHGAFLAANSYPFRTSPVKRGRWVVDQLLCLPPGEIPADVPPLDENPASGSVRERMEQHRSDPSCAACHVMMDPIGFGLESFDPIGRSRTVDVDGYVIDDDDLFFDTAFTNPAGLAGALKNESSLAPCMVEKLGSYTLGRGLDQYAGGDACTVDDIVARADARGFSLSDILQATVESDAFQMRQAADSSDDPSDDGTEP